MFLENKSRRSEGAKTIHDIQTKICNKADNKETRDNKEKSKPSKPLPMRDIWGRAS